MLDQKLQLFFQYLWINIEQSVWKLDFKDALQFYGLALFLLTCANTTPEISDQKQNKCNIEPYFNFFLTYKSFYLFTSVAPYKEQLN